MGGGGQNLPHGGPSWAEETLWRSLSSCPECGSEGISAVFKKLFQQWLPFWQQGPVNGCHRLPKNFFRCHFCCHVMLIIILMVAILATGLKQSLPNGFNRCHWRANMRVF